MMLAEVFDHLPVVNEESSLLLLRLTLRQHVR